jgi:glycosyltransferase involved in cell wall biosynthesis
VNDSLSIILPVKDAEAQLDEQVHELLETLPDLTNRFDILVIDDASADHTPEVAAELARQFPQVRFIRHQEPQGRDAAIHTGVSRALGQTLLVNDSGARVSPTDLRRLWSLRHDRHVVMARAQQPGTLDPALVERLCTWGQTLRSLARGKLTGGLQMIRRDAAESYIGQPASVVNRQNRANSAKYTTAPTARP